jgi:hypothetical protein
LLKNFSTWTGATFELVVSYSHTAGGRLFAFSL